MKDISENSHRFRTDQQICGQAGEEEALTYLKQQGLKLLQRNFRCKGGEIDLIMQERDVVVFVEVRKRADMRYGGAAASITFAKKKRLILAARRYLQSYRTLPACRFDVIAIDGSELSWLKNVLEAY